jgi:adenosine deaminase
MASDAALSRLDLATLRALPKVELHVHLEGSFSPERIAALAEAAGVALPRPPDQLFQFTDLGDFLSLLDLWCGLVRTPEQVYEIANDFAVRLAGDGIAYAEVMVNSTHWSSVGFEDLIEAVDAGFQRAREDGMADCRVLVSLLRGQTAAEAMQIVEWMGTRQLPRVAGLSLDGNEVVAGRASARFAAAYARAAELGFGLTAHAGESSGSEGVRDALDLLGVSRVDHGVRAVDDPVLLQRLADEGIACNVCVTSNLSLIYPDIDSHPVRRMVDAGVPVTINTDDPEPLDIDLNDEVALVAGHLGWGIEDVVGSTRQAIDAAFCDADRGRELNAMLDEFLAGLARSQPPRS